MQTHTHTHTLLHYPQCSVALGAGPGPWKVRAPRPWPRPCAWRRAAPEAECIWRPWGCWWCGFRPTCCDRTPASPPRWCWGGGGAARSQVAPKKNKKGAGRHPINLLIAWTLPIGARRPGLTSSMASTSVVKLGLDLYFWMTEERRVLPAHSMNTWRRRGAGLSRAVLPAMRLDDTGRDGTGFGIFFNWYFFTFNNEIILVCVCVCVCVCVYLWAINRQQLNLLQLPQTPE